MFSLREFSEGESKDSNEKRLIFYGNPVNRREGYVYQPSYSTLSYGVNAISRELSQAIAKHRFNDIPVNCQIISLTGLCDVVRDVHVLTAVRRVEFTEQVARFVDKVMGRKKKKTRFYVEVCVDTPLLYWKEMWSIAELHAKIRSILPNELKLVNYDSSFEYMPLLFAKRVQFPVHEENSVIFDVVLHYQSLIFQLVVDAVDMLMEESKKQSVIVLFDFPEEVKIICNQYLLYFVQFLKDVGIEATAELKEDAGRTLFAVTPKDQNEALDNIRDALNIYLRLPTVPHVDPTAIINADVSVQLLAANIQHLQTQLMMHSAMIQQKDILIDQQRELIGLLSRGQIIIGSVEKPDIKPEEDREPVIGDVVKVKPYDIGGFAELDLPTLVRRLKGMFGK